MDIVQRLTTVAWNDGDELCSLAADEIERLRKQLANRPRIDEPMLKGATDTAALIVNELRQQLAAMTKELDDLRILNDNNIASNIEIEKERDEARNQCVKCGLLDAAKVQLATVTKERDELRDALYALAKVGADKTGEK